MSGAVTPASSMRCLMAGTAAAASGRFTVMRTSSDPACASSMHCRAVRLDVGRVGVGHRLHGDGRTAADLNRTDLHADGLMKPDGKHLQKFVRMGSDPILRQARFLPERNAEARRAG